MKMSMGVVTVLHAVADGKRFGFEIMDATGFTSGTVYPALDRLEEERCLKSSWEDARVAHKDGRPPRRYFSMTATGAAVLGEAMLRFKSLRPVPLTVTPGKARR